jgi:hypothetical protein
VCSFGGSINRVGTSARVLLLQADVENVWVQLARAVICSRASDALAIHDNEVCIPSSNFVPIFENSLVKVFDCRIVITADPATTSRSLTTKAIANDCLPWCCFEDLTHATTDVTDPLYHQDY